METQTKEKASQDTGEPRKAKRPLVASTHTHFNIYRDLDAPIDGPVTVQEQIRALKRHVAFHERAAVVARELVARLENEQSRPSHRAEG